MLPAIEVVDSRYRDYRFKAVDNIADNSSAARYLLGAPRALSDCGDLRLVGVLLSIDGVAVDQGLGAAALGSPLAAVAWLVRHLSIRGACREYPMPHSSWRPRSSGPIPKGFR